MQEQSFTVRFWGVRGSIPSPGPDTAMVGGNTACIEVCSPTTRVILDAGSGLRALGDALVAKGEHRSTTVLLSHVHWDHIMGVPFFAPLYMSGCEVRFASGDHGAPLHGLLQRQMSAPMFPVDLSRCPAHLAFERLADGARHRVGDIDVEMTLLNHPDPVYAFRLEHGGRSVVYATDTEHPREGLDDALVRLARGADVLIYDAQYTPEEYVGEVGPSRVGWGHSTFAAGAEIAEAAGAATLALFHHDPRRTDEGVAAIVRRARGLFDATVAAREGMTFELGLRGAGLDAA